MSNNHFYNDFRGSTFQNNFMPPFCVPPPPRPPPHLFVLPPPPHAPNFNKLDQEFLKTFESKGFNVTVNEKPKLISISQVRDKLRHLALALNDLKSREKLLAEKVNSCSEEEWKKAMDEVNSIKSFITDLSSNANTYLDTLRKLITKRTAKRLRLKRLRIEKKRAKEDRIKEQQEKSRKIDENLQKIKDAIIKTEQEEESKLQADIVLKEVLRKKHNAKKFISKLDALMKLRSARANTSRGRGATVSVQECEEFDGKIDKIKMLWAQKLISYDKEEEDLRAKLNEDKDTNTNEGSVLEEQVTIGLKKWRKVLFGDSTGVPQVDFGGDLARFVGVRCQWDQYISESGSSLPIGWVTPSMPST